MLVHHASTTDDAGFWILIILDYSFSAPSYKPVCQRKHEQAMMMMMGNVYM